MKKRLITAFFGFAVLIPVWIFSDTFVLPFAVGLFTAVGVYEMLGCIGVRNKLEVSIPTVIIATAIPVSARYVVAYTGEISYFLAMASALMFLYMLYLMSLAVLSKGTKTVNDMALVFLTTFYISVGFMAVLMVRDLEHGVYLWPLVFIGAWIPDGAAYFVGRALGRHKLIPDVSPNKTVEGAIGGIVFGAIFFALYGLGVGVLTSTSSNIGSLLIAGVVVSVISIFGDLIASLIKRQYGVKDYGTIFPGHGGVLDRFDSIIATAPILLMLCAFPNVFSLFC
ncbi:MAG: phosphatidate cytidylyltransferase [Clostridia bacterium]|nr:phosphatidate cytidylyltransferase [Clostridia bacterium]